MSEFLSNVVSWIWTIVCAAGFVLGLPFVAMVTSIPDIAIIIVGTIVFFAILLGGLFVIGQFTEFECCTEHL